MFYPAVAGARGRGPVKDDRPDYKPTLESLGKHLVPQWFKDAKFGIFIHWGIYSVPAFAPDYDPPYPPGPPYSWPQGTAYAEWYWYSMHDSNNDTYSYHRRKYGENFNYDDFIPWWKAEKFDARSWVRLFEEAGARYFAQVSKHHDGFALFPSRTTNRSTTVMGPRRNLAGELFGAARKHSKLKAGFYYSLAEWYNPAGVYSPFTGWSRPPYNPYTGERVPYTGYKPIDDYVRDHDLPQLRELIDGYDPDILWADGADPGKENYWRSNEIIAYYYNQAKDRHHPKEVVVNDRFGEGSHGDFSTPEYAKESDIKQEKWESTRGIGLSFGYNAQETEEDYLTPDELIDLFVDIVSKNGNLLLNIGPKADGTVPQIMQDRLRALGTWLRINGEAIYGSTYWKQAEDDGSNVPVRFAVKPSEKDGFYATALNWPGKELIITAQVPISKRSRIQLLGARGKPLEWTRRNGRLIVQMPREGESATESRHAYTFKIINPTRKA